MKKIFALMLAIVMTALVASPAYAAVPETVQPRYTYIDSASASLSINTSTGIATCKSELMTTSSIRVRLVMYLQMYQNSKWETVMTWENTGTQFASLSKTRSITVGNTYRTYAVGYVLDANGVILEVSTIYAY